MERRRKKSENLHFFSSLRTYRKWFMYWSPRILEGICKQEKEYVKSKKYRTNRSAGTLRQKIRTGAEKLGIA